MSPDDKKFLSTKEKLEWKDADIEALVVGAEWEPPTMYPNAENWIEPYLQDFVVVEGKPLCAMQMSMFGDDEPEEQKYDCSLGSFHLHENADDFMKVVEQMSKARRPVALDIETNGLHFDKNHIRTVQVSNDGEHSHVLLCERAGNRVRPALQRLLRECPVILQNGTFDLAFLLVYAGVFPTNYCFDTLLAAQNLDAGMFEARDKAFNLGALAERYLGIYVDKSMQKSFIKRMNEPLSMEQLRYAANDTLATWRIAMVQAQLLEAKKLWRTFKELDMPSTAVAVDVKVRGVPVHKPTLLTLKETNEPLCAALEKRLEELLSISEEDIKADVFQNSMMEWAPDLAEGGVTLEGQSAMGIDPNAFELVITPTNLTRGGKVKKSTKKDSSIAKSHQQLLEAFHRMGYTDLVSTGEGAIGTYFLGRSVRKVNDEDLEIIRAKCPAAATLLEHRDISKGLDYIVKGFLGKFYNEKTGCVHPNLNVCGSLSEADGGAGKDVATGRWSSSGPNLQNIKADQAWRDIFKAPPGYLIIKTDASQQEVRVMAEVSGDPALRDIYINAKPGQKVDIYSETAARVLEKPISEVTKKERQIYKAIVLAIGYGGQAKTIAESAGISKEEAAKAIERYFIAFPKVKEFIRVCERKARNEGFLQNNFSGRRRHWNHERLRGYEFKYMTQAANFLIQGGAADCGKKALLLAYKELAKLGCRPLPPVHDEMVFLCPADKANEATDLLSKCMVDGSEYFMEYVPMAAEGAIGRSWQKEPGKCECCGKYGDAPKKPEDATDPEWYWRKGFKEVKVRKVNDEWIPVCGRCYLNYMETMEA